MNEKEEESKYKLDDEEKVLYYCGTFENFYPFCLDYECQEGKHWKECSGVYTYSEIKKLELIGKIIFWNKRGVKWNS